MAGVIGKAPASNYWAAANCRYGRLLRQDITIARPSFLPLINPSPSPPCPRPQPFSPCLLALSISRPPFPLPHFSPKINLLLSSLPYALPSIRICLPTSFPALTISLFCFTLPTLPSSYLPSPLPFLHSTLPFPLLLPISSPLPYLPSSPPTPLLPARPRPFAQIPISLPLSISHTSPSIRPLSRQPQSSQRHCIYLCYPRLTPPSSCLSLRVLPATRPLQPPYQALCVLLDRTISYRALHEACYNKGSIRATLTKRT